MKNAPALLVFTTVPWEHALSVLRFRAPAEALGWRVLSGKEGTQDVYPERVSQADVVLVQRDFPRFYPAYRKVVTLAHQQHKPLVYDLDDLLFALPETHPSRDAYVDTLGGMLEALLEADRVVLSTPFLRDLLRPLRPDAIVWPTLLPEGVWEAPHITSPNDKPVHLGYIGGNTHGPDVAVVAGVLLRLLDAYPMLEAHFWGGTPPEGLDAHPRVRHIQPEMDSYYEFAASLKKIPEHIWLAPLQVNLFNRCKSAIKFWEYAALGGAGVYSRMEPYTQVVRDGENGFLASDSGEWEMALRSLLDEPDLRSRIAHEARATLRSEGMLGAHLSAWEKIYTSSPLPGARRTSSDLMQMFSLFSRQVQERSEECHQNAIALRHLETHNAHLKKNIQELEMHNARQAKTIQELLASLNALYSYAHQLEIRSAQLDEILHSRSWQVMQRLHKLRRLDFSPLEEPSLPPDSPEDRHE